MHLAEKILLMQPLTFGGDYRGSNTPSGKSGHGLGDLGYAEQVFAQNEAIQWFFMPIVNHTQDKIFISPYIISRDNPTVPLIAPSLNICSVEDFPEAEFPVQFHLSNIAQRIDEIASGISDQGPEKAVNDLSMVIEQIAALQAQIVRSSQHGTLEPIRKEVAEFRVVSGAFSHRTIKEISTIIQLQYAQTSILGVLAFLALTASIIAIWPQTQSESVVRVELPSVDALAPQARTIEMPVRQIELTDEHYLHGPF